MRIFLIALLFFMTFSVNAQKKLEPDFRFIADFYSQPFIFETDKSIYSFALNGDLSFFLKLNSLGVGLSVWNHSFFMNPQDPAGYASGFWNIQRWTVDGFYRFRELFELSWGAGAAWKYTDLTIRDRTDITGDHHFGISGVLNFFIYPGLKFMRLESRNSADVFYDPEKLQFYPYIMSGLRLTFHPGLSFINLYTEVTGLYFQQSDRQVTFSSGLVLFTAGVSIDMAVLKTVSDYRKRSADLMKTKDMTTDIRITDATSDPSFKKTEPQKKLIDENVVVDAFKNYFISAEKNTILEFTEIRFEGESSELIVSSYPVLDKIVEILKEFSNISIAVGGYAGYSANPEKELELSVSRAKKIYEYFAAKGIAADRVKVIASGRLFSRETNPAKIGIEIKIIKK
jgi:outer membrane protein OmpA-like peptidoglycan-associated protein